MHNLMITVDTGEVHSFEHVLERLKRAGLQVRHSNSLLGIVTGSVPPEQLPALKTVEGVISIEEGREL